MVCQHCSAEVGHHSNGWSVFSLSLQIQMLPKQELMLQECLLLQIWGLLCRNRRELQLFGNSASYDATCATVTVRIMANELRLKVSIFLNNWKKIASCFPSSTKNVPEPKTKKKTKKTQHHATVVYTNRSRRLIQNNFPLLYQELKEGEV